MDFRKLLDKWSHLEYIHPEDIPNIELYMDQVTTFMDRQLEGCKRTPEDKILTKTMINNYSKNHLLPPSNKKKYSKEHIILLIYIYYLKNFLSISDIKNLLTPLTELFYDKENPSISFEEIYAELFSEEIKHNEALKKDIFRTLKESRSTFSQIKHPDEQEFLQNLAFITTLSYDIYLKKQIIESIIDNFYAPEDEEKKNKKKK
ncbi:MAG: DUF1836 domain-containing protein [Lachnospiraceae bacterium]|nr:DUF1836 domain-containing protein [Lachnospiraceae bacterium]